MRLALGETLGLAGIAVGLGLVGSLALNRVLQTLLFDIKPTDPVTLAIVCLVIFIVSAIAAALPARRATGPMIALRYE